MLKVLNLYAGIGGNRKLWDAEVTAVELSPDIAELYQSLYPNDQVIVGDAHQYLLDHYDEFDFIWSSPPCQSHSKMNKATRHKLRRYPDFSLYEEIVFLGNYFDGHYIIENVKPYYTPPYLPTHIVGRHYFWSSFNFIVNDVARPKGFINLANMEGKKRLMDWLGIHFDKNIYYDGNHCPAQILRNCVHPELGRQIFGQLNGRN